MTLRIRSNSRRTAFAALRDFERRRRPAFAFYFRRVARTRYLLIVIFRFLRCETVHTAHSRSSAYGRESSVVVHPTSHRPDKTPHSATLSTERHENLDNGYRVHRSACCTWAWVRAKGPSPQKQSETEKLRAPVPRTSRHADARSPPAHTRP